MNSLHKKRRVAPVHRRLRRLVVALLVAGVSLACATASAKDNKASQDSKGSAVKTQSLDQKLHTYWSVDRHLPAVKDRLYTRAGRFGLGIFTGLLSSEPFYYYYPVGLRASYYFSNFWGVELEGSYMGVNGVLTHDTELTTFLKSKLGPGYKAADTEDRFLWRGNAMVVWHPLYGKLAFLQRKLTHFDINLALGLGGVGVQRPDDVRSTTSSTVAPELAFGGGVQFFATQNVVLRLEGRAYLYEGAKTPSSKTISERIQVPTEFQLGASYLF